MADHLPPNESDDLGPWTASDDDDLRSALMTLREDVDATPLPEPAWVRAQADRAARRRVTGWLAAAAAAAVVVAAIGFGVVGRDRAAVEPRPAHSSTVSTPAPSPSGPDAAALLARRGVLPLAAEWRAALGLPRTPRVRAQPATDTIGGVCAVDFGAGRLGPDQFVGLTPDNPGVVGIQQRWTYPDATAARAAFRTLAAALSACAVPGSTATDDTTGGLPKGSAKVVAVSTGAGPEGGAGVVRAGRDIAYLEVPPGWMEVPSGGFQRLAGTALARLQRYGTPAAPGAATGGTGTPSPQQSSGATATSPVRIWALPGHSPDPIWFTHPSVYGSQLVSRGAPVVGRMPAFEGEVGVAPCDVDTSVDGTVGVAGYVRSDTGTFVGLEKIRALSSGAEAAALQRRLATAYGKGCTEGEITIESTRATGTTLTMFRLTQTAAGATLTDWVLVEHLPETSVVLTIVLHDDDSAWSNAQGFGELERIITSGD